MESRYITRRTKNLPRCLLLSPRHPNLCIDYLNDHMFSEMISAPSPFCRMSSFTSQMHAFVSFPPSNFSSIDFWSVSPRPNKVTHSSAKLNIFRQKLLDLTTSAIFAPAHESPPHATVPPTKGTDTIKHRARSRCGKTTAVWIGYLVVKLCLKTKSQNSICKEAATHGLVGSRSRSLQELHQPLTNPSM